MVDKMKREFYDMDLNDNYYFLVFVFQLLYMVIGVMFDMIVKIVIDMVLYYVDFLLVLFYKDIYFLIVIQMF